ncbi:MAG: TetR/AcrR family transcriptional regulator [Solirubrobacterales bacterium]|nr:TetR/AcrR family transcriptional regulator [Solirubrobacterales bacterium]
MTATSNSVSPSVAARPKRSDARRNYEKVLAAARDAFAEGGAEASLEEIARRAGVGIGTLYRNFPNRQALLEAVYVEEVEALCASATRLDNLPPWESLVAWLHGFVAYIRTKQALAPELLDHLGRDASVFRSCREALVSAGAPLLTHAQEAGVVRPDTDLDEVLQLVGGVAKIPGRAPEEIDHMLDIALDGLRYRA